MPRLELDLELKLFNFLFSWEIQSVKEEQSVFYPEVKTEVKNRITISNWIKPWCRYKSPNEYKAKLNWKKNTFLIKSINLIMWLDEGLRDKEKNENLPEVEQENKVFTILDTRFTYLMNEDSVLLFYKIKVWVFFNWT